MIKNRGVQNQSGSCPLFCQNEYVVNPELKNETFFGTVTNQVSAVIRAQQKAYSLLRF